MTVHTYTGFTHFLIYHFNCALTIESEVKWSIMYFNWLIGNNINPRSHLASLITNEHKHNQKLQAACLKLHFKQKFVPFNTLYSTYKHAHLLLREFFLFEGALSIWIDLDYTAAQCQQGPVGKNDTNWVNKWSLSAKLCLIHTLWQYM